MREFTTASLMKLRFIKTSRELGSVCSREYFLAITQLKVDG